jgi:hypothetical protein
MNRLVIIGNGFDLAHGLPTSYKHFIDDYWENVIQESKSKDVYEDDLFSLKLNKKSIGRQGTYELVNDVKCYKTLKLFTIKNGKSCYQDFKNKFFLCLSDVATMENWVDIENLYYKKLKGITKSDSLPISQKKIRTIILNQEFEQIRNLLEKYLKEKVLGKFNLGLFQDSNEDIFKFLNILKPISVSNELDLFKEFPKNDHNELENLRDDEKFKTNKEKLLFVLNFNYTPTVLRYLISQKANENFTKIHIPIHGTLGDEKHNKINFGFGDEMDDDYKIIENLDDNEYLKNFKSFKYLQNLNYKSLLNFIDSEKFQVLIMGHSCGLSDRTLLNTVFEHNNCRSIKVFYHQKEDGTDNYTEIIQNISRHFNKKKLMREKIVNKTLCQPLPQIQLPLK